jgi:hypothetical protein
MTRTAYMQQIMNETYPQIVIEAVNGGFKGAWQRLIAKRLQKDCKADHSEAIEICDSVGNDLTKASYLVTSSKIVSHDTA